MDGNGYNASIMTTEPGECYICGFHRETARHEIFNGPDRRLSKKYGLWVDVCPACHARIHADGKKYDYLKNAAQRRFEALWGHDEFIRIFKVNYLWPEEWQWTD